MKGKKPSAIEAFLALSDEEKDRECREYDKEFIADSARPLTPAQRKLWENAKARQPSKTPESLSRRKAR